MGRVKVLCSACGHVNSLCFKLGSLAFHPILKAKKITGHSTEKSHGQKLKTTEGQSQKVSGIVHRVSMAGYGVIKSPEWGEILWRQFELPTNLRCLQFTDRAKFVVQVEHREEYRRLKDNGFATSDACVL